MASVAEQNNQPVVYDVDGYEALTPAIMDLLNQYPGLTAGDSFTFSKLSETGGKAMFPNTGAIIERQRISIIGKVYQECVYPFYVYYRAAGLSEGRRVDVKEWLDNVGRWLERQPIKIDDTFYTLESYPELTQNRKIIYFQRQSPAFLNDISEDKVEDWAISISLRYSNEFRR